MGERDGEWRADGRGGGDSSLFGGKASKKKGRKEGATYGSRRGKKTAPLPPPQASTSTSKARERRDLRSMLIEAGLSDPDVLSKAQGVHRAWTNILEATYEVQRKGKGKEVQRECDEPRMRSLVELMALEVGWGIEDAVQSCMEGAQEDLEPRRRSGMGDLDGDEEAGDGDSSLESIRVKGSLEEGQEDGNLLADEWYESCPDYCSR